MYDSDRYIDDQNISMNAALINDFSSACVVVSSLYMSIAKLVHLYSLGSEYLYIRQYNALIQGLIM